ncbi:MAG: alpha-glucan phosphorylase [Saprospiraceae bacterium]|nr:MAG: alpha-glucan phosphorylase [Saprospiraceae bacterium]
MIAQWKDRGIKLKRIFIESQLPDKLKPLEKLSQNIFWSWNQDATDLFHAIDSKQLIALGYNPRALLENLSQQRIQELLADKAFMKKLSSVEKVFDAYVKQQPAKGSPQIAYFSMEYGIHISLRLYSGGLGVLAGDYLKEASDLNVNMVAVGLLYRFGYFQQSISPGGDQINNYPVQEFTKLPIQPVRDGNDEWLRISIGLGGRMVFAKVWELKVGRISLYLLDTDLDENSWEDRSLTHQLYGGDNEHRLKQEILLGMGGVMVLNALGIKANIYHCNEGHAAFLNLERLKNLVEGDGFRYHEALEIVRASSLFTTHTPVPAGHDAFNESLLKNYFTNLPGKLGISWHEFMALGKVNADDPHEIFSMSHLAIRLSQEVNGVSKLHGEVSRKMFNVLYPGFNAAELHIGYVTNGVHYPTWIAKEWHELYLKTFGADFLKDQSNKDYWRKIHKVADRDIMTIRQGLKSRLLDYVKAKLQSDLTHRGENPRAIFEVINNINNNALVFGFARRFATYKRAHLLFTNIERLNALLNNPERPVIILFAGKAHPADGGGQDLIRHIINISKRPEFAGKVIFLENYNMEMAKLLVQGVDVWLNTPTRPKEASGTSGMKAALNGVMNFSVLDGWWAEGYRPDAGWALPMERTFEDQHQQNELDAETIYNILEHNIIPTYYDKNEAGISEKWVGYIKQIIAEVAPDFTMKRMIDHYFERFYNKLFAQSKHLVQKSGHVAKELARWKSHISHNWNAIEVVSQSIPDTENHQLQIGDLFQATIQLYLPDMTADEVGLEVVFFKRVSEEELEIRLTKEMTVKNISDHRADYHVEVDPQMSGVYEFGFRMFPKHKLLAHHQDLNLVTWLEL